MFIEHRARQQCRLAAMLMSTTTSPDKLLFMRALT
jgi:hypothetical protein